jgi:hypothetical protein
MLVSQAFDLKAESKLTIAPGIMNFDYVETDPDGQFLDGEYGNIPGVDIAWEVKTRESFSLGFEFALYSGEVDYDGHINSIDPAYDRLPLQSKTDQSVSSLAGVLRHPFSNNPNLAFYGKLMLKRWERDIQSTLVSGIDNNGNPFQNLYVSGLFEVYEWKQFNFGLSYQLRMSQVSYLEFSGGFFRTLDPTMEVESLRFKLGEAWGYEGGLAWKYAIDQHHNLGVGGRYTYWEFGRSDVIFGFYEPDSESIMININFLYEHAF